MSYPVSYHCPRCGAVAELRREGYLADKAVTPYPLEGWTYADPDGDLADADGVRFVCGEPAEGLSWPTRVDPNGDPTSGADGDGAGEDEGDVDGCGEPFYLSFVRYEEGDEVEPRAPAGEQVTIAGAGPDAPGGPGGPDGPDGTGGFY